MSKDNLGNQYRHHLREREMLKQNLISEFVVIMKKTCELTDDHFVHKYLFEEIEKWEEKL